MFNSTCCFFCVVSFVYYSLPFSSLRRRIAVFIGGELLLFFVLCMLGVPGMYLIYFDGVLEHLLGM